MSDPRWPKYPVKLDMHGLTIIDSNFQKVFDIRGWGSLTGGGALRLPYDEAEKLQIEIGQRVVDFLNGTEVAPNPLVIALQLKAALKKAYLTGRDPNGSDLRVSRPASEEEWEAFYKECLE